MENKPVNVDVAVRIYQKIKDKAANITKNTQKRHGITPRKIMIK